MPAARTISPDGAPDEVAFWNAIDSVPQVSTGDAVTAMALYAGVATGSGPTAFATQVAALKQRDLLPADFDAPADRAIDRGTLARFVAISLNLPRGLTASIVGMNGRYAIRELEFRGLLPPSSPGQSVSGAELVGILSRAEEFQTAAIASAGPTTPTQGPPTQGPTARPAAAAPQSPPLQVGRPLPDVQLVSRSLDAMMLAFADADPATAPATTSPDGGKRFVLTNVRKAVKVKPPGAKEYVVATEGMVIDEQTQISTGLGASAVLTGPDGQTVSLKQLTRALLRYTSADGTNTTRLELDRGQVAAEIDTAIEGAGQKYDLQIQSPRSTLAIKGTRVALYDQRPYDVEARSFTGTATFETFQRQRVAFGKRGGGLVTVTGKSSDPTGVALAAATSDPSDRNARTDSEASLVSNFFSRNTTVRFDRFTELPTITGGSIPQNLQEFQPFLTGELALGARWSGTANLNIEVIESPDANGNGTGTVNAGRVLYPYSALASQGNAKIPFDHRGGPNGGFEVANINDPVPGKYTLLVQNLSTATAYARFNAVVNGKRLAFYDERLSAVGTTPKLTVSGHQSQEFTVFYQSTPPVELPIDLPFSVAGSKAARSAAASVQSAPAALKAAPAKIGPIAPTPMIPAAAARRQRSKP